MNRNPFGTDEVEDVDADEIWFSDALERRDDDDLPVGELSEPDDDPVYLRD